MIIISDKSIDQYESNLMRRICGLIYFSDKMCAEIKLQILKKMTYIVKDECINVNLPIVWRFAQ